MLTALLLITLSQTPPRTGKPISIFIGPNTRDGFVDVDRGVLDSINDIHKELRQRWRGFTIAAEREEATVVLLVVGRRISGEVGAVGVVEPGLAAMTNLNRRAIDTIIRVEGYEKALTSEDEQTDTWRGAAKQVIKDLAAWVNANLSVLPDHKRTPRHR